MSDSGDTSATAAPQYSPDGHWWWTGTEWVPADQAPVAALEPEPEPEPESEPEPFAPPEPSWPSPTPQAPWPTPTPMPGQQEWPPGPAAAPNPAGWGPAPQPGWPAQPGGWAPQGPGGPATTSGLAIAALVVAFIPGPGSLAAIILGAIALSRIGESNGQQKGRGLAIAGLVLGSLFFVIAILAAIAIPTFLNQRLKGWDAETKTALKNAAVAQESYYTENRQYTDSVDALTGEGFGADPDVTVVVALSPDGSQYCMQGIHRSLPDGHASYSDHVWYIGSTTATVSTSPDVACP